MPSEIIFPTTRRYNASFTYFVQATDGGPIKIGRTNDVEKRLRSLQANCPAKLRWLGWMSGSMERHLHERFAAHRLHGEWFAPAEGLIEFIEKYANGSDGRPAATQYRVQK